MYPVRERHLMARFVEHDPDWAEAQMAAAGFTTDGKANMRQILAAVDAGNFKDATAVEARLAQALKLVRGHALVDMRERNESWADVKPGGFIKGDRVRIKPDAYDSGSAKQHNGRRGRVSGVSGRFAIVTYDEGGLPSQHSPDKLQKSA